MDVNTTRMISLNGSNYHIWKGKMEDLLYCKNYHRPILGDSAKPENTSDVDWELLNRQVCGYIRQWVDDNVHNHISDEKNAYALWKKLDELYARKTGGNKLYLIKKLMNLKYKDGSPVTDHLNEMQGIINQLASMKIAFDDEVQALWLLGSLPDSWETFRVSITNSAPDGIVTVSMVKSGMLNEETRRKAAGTTGQTELLVTENRGRSKTRFLSSREKSRSKSQSKKNVECYYCHKKGHIQRYCRLWKKEQEKGLKKDEQKADEKETVATVSNDFLMLCHGDQINVTSEDSSWVVDSGSSVHVTSKRHLFSSYTAGDFGVVQMGDDGVAKAIGIGDVPMETSNGTRLLLKNVKHIPDVRLNLISVGKLDDAGYCSSFGDGQWKLTKGAMVVARGKKVSTLYIMQVKCPAGVINAAVDDVSGELWHRRLNHMGQKGLDALVKKGYVSTANSSSLKPCVDCLAGKQCRIAFKSTPPQRKSEILELVHSDVCGPMKDRTLGGAVYFVTFIDDYSRKVWIYILKTKDQVADVFKQFHASVERETGKKLKCIRTDNGGEYLGPFDEYCRVQGIRHQKTPPKTPQLNGLAERMNRTLMERVRCLLSHAKLPTSFWGEALLAVVHVINLTPCIPLQLDVPQRVWSGKEVSYKHLRVFGCRAFVHIPKDERSKLDTKTRECIFLGYGEDNFGYRLYDVAAKKLVRSRDVVFFEDQTIADVEKMKPDSKKQQEEPVDLDLVPPLLELSPDDDTDTPVDEILEPIDQVVAESSTATQIQLRRSERERKQSTRYPSDEYALLTEQGEPESYREAITDDKKEEWVKAMEEEMKSLHDNHTYELVKLPKGKRPLKNKWVYRLKTEEKSSRPRYKARLVVKGFSQKEGVDFSEIFSPVVKMSSIRVALGLAASMDLEIEQMDVKTAFLHGDLEEEIYMEQPEGFMVKGKEDLVCRLKKSLYGLKQAPRQWYKKFESFMGEYGFVKTTSDHCVFTKRHSDGDFLIVLLYVDDMLIIARDMSKIDRLKKEMSQIFAMKDLGPAKKIIGMSITRNRKAKKLWLSQKQYVEKVLERFCMDKAKPVSTPLANHFKLSSTQSPSSEKEKEEMKKIPYASAVGSLMYAMVCTRPDTAHAVGVVSRFLSNPGRKHWEAVKWILRYLRGTSQLCLCFGGDKPLLVGYTDSDMAGDIDNRKSTSGYLMTFAGGAVAWQSRLQKCVALSSTEAEFIAATEACKEVLWMKGFLQELEFQQERYVLHCDNQSAIHLSKNHTFHSKSKHIDVRYHWIRDVLDSKMLELVKIHTDDNGSDMMTKALPHGKLDTCRMVAGMETLPTWA